MRALTFATLTATICISSAVATAQKAGRLDPKAPARIEALQPFIAEATGRFRLPETWIRAVIAAESGGYTEFDGKPITSPAGAMGPMQVMPETYAEMRIRYKLGPDPYDPENNILAGTAYLAELYRRFGLTGMFAAYNAGPDRYQQFLDSGRPLPAETKAYLATLRIAAPARPTAPSFAAGESLFFPLQDRFLPAPATPPDGKSGGLFVPLAKPTSDPSDEKKRR